MIEYRVKKIAPCKGCEQRHVGCHSTCNNYKEWQKMLDEEKERFWKAEGATCAYRSMAAERKVKAVKANIRNKK